MILAQNRKARFDYEILQELEAGLVLEGWEVKSLRSKNLNMKSSWIRVGNGEAWLINMKIAAWRFGNTAQQNPLAERKILLHKREILKLESQINEKKYTLVPLQIYLKKGTIKCLLGLGKGRQKYEKKQVLKDRDQKRETAQAIKKL